MRRHQAGKALAFKYRDNSNVDKRLGGDSGVQVNGSGCHLSASRLD